MVPVYNDLTKHFTTPYMDYRDLASQTLTTPMLMAMFVNVYLELQVRTCVYLRNVFGIVVKINDVKNIYMHIVYRKILIDF